MKIEQIDPKKLKASAYNPRQLPEKAEKDLGESIKRFGLIEPLVVNKHKGRENIVIGGHQRLKIAISKGLKTVPVVYLNLDKKRERELNLRLKSRLHPTMKPIKVLRKLILSSSKIGEIVFDGFGGSGSTLIACEQTRRRCVMMEIEPEYCEVIKDRYNKLFKK